MQVHPTMPGETSSLPGMPTMVDIFIAVSLIPSKLNEFVIILWLWLSLISLSKVVSLYIYFEHQVCNCEDESTVPGDMVSPVVLFVPFDR